MSDEKKPVTEAPATAAPQSEAPKEQVAELTIQDLQGIKTIIDVASSRGAFKPNEMLSVGTVYGKLESFLNAVAKNAPQPQETPKEGGQQNG